MPVLRLNAVAHTRDVGHSFGMLASVATTSVAATTRYEFPERKPSAASSEIDSEYTFTMEGGVYRRSAGPALWHSERDGHDS